MSKDIILEILPNGHIKFKRGDKEHNKCMIEILSSIVEDPEVLNDLSEFFKGSEEIEVLTGDTIFCG